MPEPTFHVSDDPAGAVADLLAAAARRGAAIVLAGGSTPAAAYERAAVAEPDWSRATAWFGDERCVPPDDERSNFGLARRTLLDRLARPPEVHRIRGELPPTEAAEAYETELGETPLDLVVLGLGRDCHTASLFPGSPQLAVDDRRVTSGPPGLEPWVDRVTLTLPALLGAASVVFLVSGAAKAEAVERAFRAEPSEDAPASLLRAGPAPVEVYLDPAAAGSALSS
jgi:6-phosphogluconolactonase